MRTPIEWDQLFLNMAHMIAQRSKDNSTQCGAVIVDQHNVMLSEGFNGPPRQLDDTQVPWNNRPEKYAYILHAEENAINYALEYGGAKRLQDSRMYCTHETCTDCMLRCIRWNIGEIVLPVDTPEYHLIRFHGVLPYSLINIQKFPKIQIRRVKYARKPDTKLP